MQNKYTGDIGDFGKYGLLRALTGMLEMDDHLPALRLGVNWYLVPDDGGNDGNVVEYLESTGPEDKSLRECDAALCEQLSHIVHSGNRSVERIAAADVLPPATIYYDIPLDYRGLSNGHRMAARGAWLQNALKTLDSCDVVFCDPDNGLEVKSCNSQLKNRSPKYCFFSELIPFVRRDQSLVIYQHAQRVPKEQQARQRAGQLRNELGIPTVWALYFGRRPCRFYFIVPSPKHKSVLQARLQSFVASPWGQHFELLQTD